MDRNATRLNKEDGQVSATNGAKSAAPESIQFFSEIGAFSQAAEKATGIVYDFASLTGLQTNFLGQLGDAYLVLNIKDCDTEDPNNLLLLGEDKAFLYSRRPPQHEAQKAFDKVLAKPYGRSTVLAFLTFSKVLSSYKQKLESLLGEIRELEQRFDFKKYRDLAFEFERLDDQLEDFHDILLKLQESDIRQVETRHISFDYSVLIAESLSLQGRYRRRIAVLSELARDSEMRTGMELNLRIEKLNDVVRRLTAITIILMMPTLVASHFGMNFVYMPELRVAWAYPAVLVFQGILVIVGVVLFKKIGWL